MGLELVKRLIIRSMMYIFTQIHVKNFTLYTPHISLIKILIFVNVKFRFCLHTHTYENYFILVSCIINNFPHFFLNMILRDKHLYRTIIFDFIYFMHPLFF